MKRQIQTGALSGGGEDSEKSDGDTGWRGIHVDPERHP